MKDIRKGRMDLKGLKCLKGLKALVFSAAAVSLAACAVCAYSADVESDLRSGIVRLHIIAQSDSEEDQAIKLEVRDAVLKSVRGHMPETEAELAASAEEIAETVLMEKGVGYGAHAEYGVFMFPEREYKGLTLPAGEYEGVRIVLGSGSGHNWWCVMYPPLCVTDGEPGVDAGADEQLRAALRSDTYDVIAGGGDVKVKFRAVELVRSIIRAVNGG